MAKGGFRGGFGGSQANMMKQAQKMQQDFLKMQQELESSKFEFTRGGQRRAQGGRRRDEQVDGQAAGRHGRLPRPVLIGRTAFFTEVGG